MVDLGCVPIVDENLFYKDVDKKAVHGARLHRSHLLCNPSSGTSLITGKFEALTLITAVSPATLTSSDIQTSAWSSNDTSTPDKSKLTAEENNQGNGQYADDLEPPYPFDTGATLLALTQKHNVSNLSGA